MPALDTRKGVWQKICKSWCKLHHSPSSFIIVMCHLEHHHHCYLSSPSQEVDCIKLRLLSKRHTGGPDALRNWVRAFPNTFVASPIVVIIIIIIITMALINYIIFVSSFCSSQPSMVHYWLSSPIFPCLFVRPAIVTSNQISLLLAPDPQTHTFSESLW